LESWDEYGLVGDALTKFCEIYGLKDCESYKKIKDGLHLYFENYYKPLEEMISQKCNEAQARGSYLSLLPENVNSKLVQVAQNNVNASLCGDKVDSLLYTLAQYLTDVTDFTYGHLDLENDGVVPLENCKSVQPNENAWSNKIESNYHIAPDNHIQLTGRYQSKYLNVREWLEAQL